MKKMLTVLTAAGVIALFGASSVFAADAATNFKNTCAMCHGANGEGKKGLCPSLKDSQFVATASADDVKATIINGRSGSAKKYKDYPSPMPSHKGKFGDADFDALVKYLKEVIQKK